MSTASVAIVLSPCSEAELCAIPLRTPSWIVAKPEFQSTIRSANKLGLVVTELFPNGNCPVEWLYNHLDSVDQHHNDFSQDPPYARLLVFGVRLSPDLEPFLSTFGFGLTREEPFGFSAFKTLPEKGSAV
jgi:hypothetical protein